MPDEIKYTETMQLQTLHYEGEEWMRVSDVIDWIKIHGERKVIPFTVSHMLVKALIRMKNAKL
jgi:uncharacterized protein YegJ (DUF2314 family)